MCQQWQSQTMHTMSKLTYQFIEPVTQLLLLVIVGGGNVVDGMQSLSLLLLLLNLNDWRCLQRKKTSNGCWLLGLVSVHSTCQHAHGRFLKRCTTKATTTTNTHAHTHTHTHRAHTNAGNRGAAASETSSRLGKRWHLLSRNSNSNSY